ncbi:MAG: ferritin family protein [Desulfobacterales bacterium]|jgi:rubrerythrin
MSDIIDLAIQIEKNAEQIYRKALSQISNPSLIFILQWLADEEVAHAEWFSQIKETIDTQVKDPAVEAMGKSLLSDVLGKQSFSLKEANFSEMDQLVDLLSLAVEFENDKVLFYKMLRPFIADDETLDFLEKIIAEETDHIQELHKLMDRHVARGMRTQNESR